MSKFDSNPKEEDSTNVMADSSDPNPELSVVGAGGNERVLSKEDFERIDALLSKERTAILEGGNLMIEAELLRKRIESTSQRAIEARGDRDKFCVELEKKYDVPPGSRWTFDYNKRAIVISTLRPKTINPSV